MNDRPPPPVPAPARESSSDASLDAPPSAAPPPPVPAGPSGPGTSSGAGSRAVEGQGRYFPCGSCGADVEFDPAAQALKCPYCAAVTQVAPPGGKTVAEQDFYGRIRWLADLRKGKRGRTSVEGLHEVPCDGCGAKVSFLGTLTSTDCAFCGAAVHRDKVHDAEDRVPVDGVLPFQVAEAKAKSLLAGWVKSRWFAPNEFLKRGAEGRFAGVYVPYWTFDSHTVSDYVGQRGDAYYVPVRVGKTTTMQRRIRWSHASGRVAVFFDDVLVVAAKGLPVELVRKLEPWPLAKCRPFDPQLLAGFLAQTYDVELEPGFREAKVRMDEGIRAAVCRDIGGDEQRIHSVDSVFDPITYKHLLLPVWLLSYRWHEKTYRVVVNAVTGEVQGTRPWSAWKIAGLVLAIGAAAAAVALLAR